MRLLMWTALLAGLAVTGLAAVPQQPSVYGKVTDPSDTQVAGVEVTARKIPTGERWLTTTDEQGNYKFSDLPEGDYRLTFRREGFQRGEKQTSVRVAIIPVKVDKKLRIAPASNASVLEGVVQDAKGAAVPGAVVTAVNLVTGFTLTTTTDEEGAYYLEMPEGTYRLEILASSFTRHEFADVYVAPAQSANVDVALMPGQIQATVPTITVSDASEVFPHESHGRPLNTTTVNERSIENLPILGRTFRDFAILQPGVSSSVNGEYNQAGASISGQHGRANNFLIDGVDTNDSGLSTSVMADQNSDLPFGSIAQVIITETILAEVGRNSAGLVYVNTKRGGNDLHGSGFYFHRNSRLDARDFFETTRRPARGHQFGFTVGGPIIKDRTFFFGGYEGRRELQSRAHLVSVPSPSRLASARALIAAGGLTENLLSTRLLSLFPPPDRAGDFHNLAVNSPAVNDSDALLVRLDHNFNDSYSGVSHTAFLRYNFSRSEQLFPLAPSFFPGFRSDFSGREQSLNAGFDSHLGAGRSNELNFSYSRNKYRFAPEDNAFNPSAFGLETGAADPERFGLPFIRITGFDPLGAPFNLPGRETASAWQLKDSFLKHINKWSLKLGMDFRRVVSDSANEAGTRGRIIFDGSVLGDPLADFLAGFPAGDTGILRGDTRRGLAINHLSLFAQADVRPHSRLSLNAGLRYDFNGVPGEAQNRLSNFVPELGELLPVGSAALAKLYENDLNNFGPRLGFAWSLTSSGRVMLRGGYGIFYGTPTPRLFAGLCPCANSTGQGVTTNPAGPSPAFALSPSGLIPFGPGLPVFGSGPDPDAAVDIHAVERRLKTPFTQSFNIGFQSEFFLKTTLEAAYQGSLGTHLYRTLDINQPTPGDPLTRDARRPFFTRFPQFRSVNLLSSSARSSYHAMTLSAKRRMSNGLSFNAAYNLSKAVDDASDAAELPQNSRDLRAERARSAFDRRHSFVLSWIYELPRPGPEVFNGWQVSGIFRAASGRPFTPVISFDNSGTGTFVDRPNLVGDPRTRADRARLYDPRAFQIPPRGTFGSVGRNSLVGPGLNSLDVSVMKKTLLPRDSSLELRFDFFNLLNRPNFRMPNQFVDHPAFGRVSATEVYGGRRRIQFGVRFLF